MAAIAPARLRIEPAPADPSDARPFLTATWRDFLMLSYEIEPRVLEPYIPRGTELDRWCGRAFVSLVGFRFCDARLHGVRVPWHQHFAEVNLRFYVRRRVDGAWRRGVVFVRELCPKRAVVAVARWVYGERFRRAPVVCHVDRDSPTPFNRDAKAERAGEVPAPRRLAFTWHDRRGNYRLAADVLEPAHPPDADSLAEFVVEHYWAYTAGARAGALEYLVTHPPWQIAAAEAEFTGDAWRLYGPRFAPFLAGLPASAFWATGSPVSVYRGVRL
jgi:uncharacterized protein YqjF (DUF2071 family)